MSYAKLYIIGNGFDLHHKIKSKYCHFQEWLKANEEIHNANYIINAYFPADADFWEDFEHGLAKFNITEFAENATAENYPNLASDNLARELDMATYQSEQDFVRLTEEIKLAFRDWICSLNKPLVSQRINIDRIGAYFINFNYTKTLENLYGVPSNRILHIHGCVDLDEDFVFGHGEIVEETAEELLKECDTDEKIQEYYSAHFDPVSQNVTESTIDGINTYLRKDVEGVMDKFARKFLELNQLKEIYIYGWSFSDVDTPYLNEILRLNNEHQIMWTISWHSKKDKERALSYLQSHNIEESMIRFVQLEDLIDNSQLSLFNNHLESISPIQKMSVIR